jgi:hypothetical protein
VAVPYAQCLLSTLYISIVHRPGYTGLCLYIIIAISIGFYQPLICADAIMAIIKSVMRVISVRLYHCPDSNKDGSGDIGQAIIAG